MLRLFKPFEIDGRLRYFECKMCVVGGNGRETL